MSRHTGILTALAVALVAVTGLIMAQRPNPVGALTLQEQAGYEMARGAYDQCNPQKNLFVDSEQARETCCTQNCLNPCLSVGISDCTTECKTVCMGKPLYKGGRQ